jgi:hypothetical protein
MPPPPSIHQINLRGPWECRVLSRGPEQDINQNPEDSHRIHLPGPHIQALLATRSEQTEVGLVYTRRFNRSPQLPAGETIWILFPAVGGTGTVQLNGRELGLLRESNEAQPAQEFEITGLLDRTNKLEVRLDISGCTSKTGLTGAAVLEFRSQE